MREFGFEVRLCARREREVEGVLARQLGASVRGGRVVDAVEVEPGPGFDERVAITPETIPDRAIAADVGAGRARPRDEAFDLPPERARAVVDRAVEVGFLEREVRGGREYVRQTARYPDWFSTLRGIENKPDLSSPGALELQLRKDVSLGLLDEVVLATASHVTGAHLNRIPPEVGVWEFDPDTGEREVVRDPEPLERGVEILEANPGRVEVRPADEREVERARRRLAERAFGKGWRPDFPACARVERRREASATLPYCPWKGRLVRAGADCGPACGGHDPADPPDVALAAERAAATPWDPDPEGRARRQSGLGRFVEED